MLLEEKLGKHGIDEGDRLGGCVLPKAGQGRRRTAMPFLEPSHQQLRGGLKEKVELLPGVEVHRKSVLWLVGGHCVA